MSLIDYQTFGTWVLCSIEKSIWLHYFHANDSQVRKAYLCHFFFDSSQTENRRFRIDTMAEFWRETTRGVRQKVFKQLVEQIQEENKNDSGKGEFSINILSCLILELKCYDFESVSI